MLDTNSHYVLRRHMISGISRITFLIIFALTAGRNLQAARQCSNEDLQGTFGEIGWGAIPSPVVPTLGGPFVRVGQTIADGQGSVVSHTAASFNGIIYQVDAYVGKYDVNPDCTVIFHMQIPIPDTPPGFLLPTDLTGVISDDGVEVANQVVSPPGLSIRILFHKQNNRQEEQQKCSNQDFEGAFGLDMFGTIISQAPNPPNVPGTLSRNGRIVFDGQGGFDANITSNYNGQVVPETFSGTYTIDQGCKIKMLYTLDKTTYTWFGGLSYGSTGATLMLTDPPGAAVVGTLTLQQ
jgi:hypothetical protein